MPKGKPNPSYQGGPGWQVRQGLHPQDAGRSGIEGAYGEMSPRKAAKLRAKLAKAAKKT
jgi:hypothetical protein